MDNDLRYAPPKSTALVEHPGGWDGEYVRLRTPGEMPCRCITCGSDAGLSTRTTKLGYINPLWYLTFFLSLLVLAIVYLVAVKRAVVRYSACADCAAKLERWSTTSKILAGLLLGSLVGCFVPGLPEIALMTLAWIAGLSLVGYLFAAAFSRPKMRVAKINNGVFFIGGLKAAYRRQLSADPKDLRF